MRKAQKQQAQDLVELLKQATEEIKTCWERRQTDAVIELLQDCQDGAVVLGEMIEECEGEGFVTVSLLEEYCERIYQMYELLANGQAAIQSRGGAWDNDTMKNKDAVVDCVESRYKALSQALGQIEKSVQEDIKVRKIAVFLPYKASMWDSLESVWREADADPACDAYVIPIPYYDKNKDGMLGQEHYEGDMYPPDVPVVRYDAFDFEVQHPDEIYIHNPYDEHNYVTSVHPFFYAKNLKKYTDRLVYIPYFVLSEVDPADQAALDRIAHFAQNAAVTHADLVIVQSENMRQCYIESMVKLAGEKTRPIWEKKILGLGSPKFDKVLRMQGQDIELPDSWKKRILKEDGSRKKVILYNTSVTSFLEYGQRMFDKMRSVFRIFKERQGEVALLWRPHPLMQATIASMRPELCEEYEQMVEQYQEWGGGIYDDSADLYRAIAVSDAYYGDPSSLVQLCQKAGLPVMIQSVEIQ